MRDFIIWLFGEKGQLLIAGALGGVVRWLSLRECWKDGLVSIVIGGICSLYLGFLAILVLEPIIGRIVIDPVSRAGFSGFVIGIGGIAVSGLVLDAWHARSEDIRRKKRLTQLRKHRSDRDA